MPPPGISTHTLATPAQRLAYRKIQAELQAAWARTALRERRDAKLAAFLAELNRMSIGDPWTIDEQGCLTRTIGE